MPRGAARSSGSRLRAALGPARSGLQAQARTRPCAPGRCPRGPPRFRCRKAGTSQQWLGRGPGRRLLECRRRARSRSGSRRPKRRASAHRHRSCSSARRRRCAARAGRASCRQGSSAPVAGSRSDRSHQGLRSRRAWHRHRLHGVSSDVRACQLGDGPGFYYGRFLYAGREAKYSGHDSGPGRDALGFSNDGAPAQR